MSGGKAVVAEHQEPGAITLSTQSAEKSERTLRGVSFLLC